MSIVHLINPEVGEIRSNLDVNNVLVEGVLTCNLAPVIPNVIFDTTDVTLSTDKIMISNGTHEIKQSVVDITNPQFTNVTAALINNNSIETAISNSLPLPMN